MALTAFTTPAPIEIIAVKASTTTPIAKAMPINVPTEISINACPNPLISGITGVNACPNILIEFTNGAKILPRLLNTPDTTDLKFIKFVVHAATAPAITAPIATIINVTGLNAEVNAVPIPAILVVMPLSVLLRPLRAPVPSAKLDTCRISFKLCIAFLSSFILLTAVPTPVNISLMPLVAETPKPANFSSIPNKGAMLFVIPLNTPVTLLRASAEPATIVIALAID